MNDGSRNEMETARPLLFEPLDLRGLTLKNRLVVPPMVHYRCGPSHTCGDFHLVHLGRYALGGFGLVFVEATGVEEVGLINENDLGLWNDAQAESFKPLVAFMKRQNTAIGIQIAHGGRKASTQSAMQGMGPLTEENLRAGSKMWQPVGPTAEPVANGWLTPHQLTTDECKAMVGKWAGAARRAVQAGFDTIEIHAAHGYLLASFLSPVSNTRNDEYGGDSTGRMRLPLQIAEAVRAEMPSTMPLFVRVSSVDGAADGWNMDDTVAFARELKARGVDVIDCSSGGISGAATAAQVTRSLGFQVPFAERVRKEVDIRTMAVGIILEAQQAEAILQDGKADLIAVGRQSQFNPNIAHHWAHDLGINTRFEDWSPEYGWWLEKRIRTLEGFATATGVVMRR
ncbi:NADPH dehydrogenase [Variibacter gotjawalensis]|uniref:NADPH dehydrogenase n=1 Tax=Variibacter gotjawalensis TaxID=1333996 RepID=A0A0S3Q005_9BRAD|nr:NADH:flavin oxidoreductase/NADH oxidase [Variibacter gotjawalensis]NIK47367.1 2,4-dienoyl-CoA reductase-like NADH-dependent reductase (Old Yellow Enzyme family) [Variibacter gotjawalensis]RZS49263.1 2,4-dienoyl-CoA reductase-like NADH-dependent reductase (Old Yellow Enzyme family) [Variibacter gotjawalensis]BAT61527.1 NADPH dehydrogenase [Variibacter gotjawalensis]